MRDNPNNLRYARIEIEIIVVHFGIVVLYFNPHIFFQS